jgi:TonB family protein
MRFRPASGARDSWFSSEHEGNVTEAIFTEKAIGNTFLREEIENRPRWRGIFVATQSCSTPRPRTLPMETALAATHKKADFHKRTVVQLPSVLMAIEQNVVAGSLDIDAALQYVTEAVASTEDFGGAAIALRVGPHLVCTASFGVAPRTGCVMDGNNGPYAECVSEGRMVVRRATDADPSPTGDKFGYRSVIILPLQMRGRFDGVLATFSTTADKFTNDQITVLGTAATICGLLAIQPKQVAQNNSRTSADSGAPSQPAVALEAIVQTTEPEVKPRTSRSSLVVCIAAALVLLCVVFGSMKFLGSSNSQQHSATSTVLPHTITEKIGDPVIIESGVAIGGRSRKLEGGTLAKRTQPEYPSDALREGIEGDVEGTMIITPAGIVNEVRIARGDPVLAAAVKSWVAHWRYSPFRLSGNTVAVAIPIRFTFRLSR